MPKNSRHNFKIKFLKAKFICVKTQKSIISIAIVVGERCFISDSIRVATRTHIHTQKAFSKTNGATHGDFKAYCINPPSHTHTHTHTQTPTHTHTHTHTCMYTLTQTHTHTRTHTHTHTCMYTLTQTHTHTHTHAHTHAHTCMYALTQTHTAS